MERDQVSAGKVPPSGRRRRLLRLVRNLAILAFVFALIWLLYSKSDRFAMHIQFVLRTLSHGDLEGLKTYLRAWGAWAPVISSFIMIIQSVVAPLPAFIVTVANGWLFGAFWGTLLSWASSMAGAMICFAIARALGRPAVEKLVPGKAMGFVDGFFQRYGNNSVLIARLIPVVSFDAVSYVAGLTPISVWGFFWASAVGELPATIVYSWLGQSLSTAARLGLWAVSALAALVILALILKGVVDRRIKDRIRRSVAARAGDSDTGK